MAVFPSKQISLSLIHLIMILHCIEMANFNRKKHAHVDVHVYFGVEIFSCKQFDH